MKALAFSGGKDSMVCLHLLRGELDCAIYVDTGFAYPETLALVEYAAGLVPMHVVKSDRNGQNERDGIPSDLVPVNWTAIGHLVNGKKECLIQSYFDCCYKNIAEPLLSKARELGVAELYDGQRSEERFKSSAQDGDVALGIVRRHPIERWTAKEVFSYLESKMTVPAHYKIKHSSLDCYDCTAFRKDSQDRIEWMRNEHPRLYGQYHARARQLDHAIREAL